MFKRKKTYLDKIDFDVFEDDQPEDFDLFSKNNTESTDENESVEDVEAEVEEVEDETDVRVEEEAEEEDSDDDEVTDSKEVDEESVEADATESEEAADEESCEDEKAEAAGEVEEKSDEDEELDEEADEEESEEDDYEDEEYEEETDDNDEDSDSEDENNEKIGFTYDDFYNIDKEIKDKKKDKEGKKSGDKIVWFALLWIVLFSAGVFAFLYFQTDLFKKKKAATTEETTEISTTESTETTEELDEEFYTIYSYQTNADVNINALMADYYDALVKGDKEKLKDIVTEPEAFGDMMIYETKAQVISEYSNITCYTIPGLNEGEILVFTTSNVTITGVNSKPLDIKQFYVVKDGNSYKINNGVLSQETIDYINVQAGSPDVQALYKSVQDNINKCLAEDSTFADFYNKISTNTDAEQEQ